MISVKTEQVLFLDIETAPVAESLLDTSDRIADLWLKKSESKYPDKNPEETFKEFAGLYPEYSQIVCVSFGRLNEVEEFVVASSFGESEVKILEGVAKILESSKADYFCAHNGMNFDYPFLTKRFLVNGIKVPWRLNSFGKKPWDMGHLLDTLKIWQGVSWGGGCSLDALTALFDIPSPKGELDGSKVREAFYSGKYFEIAEYCEQDVVALARVFQCMKLDDWVKDKNVISKTNKEDLKV